MNEKLAKLFQFFYIKFPVFRPILHSLYGKFLAHYTFSGWGMKTVNELPWKGNLEQDFRKDCIDLKDLFEFTPNSTGTDKNNVDELWWRHWMIHFCIVYVNNFTTNDEYNFVECGVGDGMTTFFACREIKRNKKFNNFKIHLYDSWSAMKSEDLSETEKCNAGRYNTLNLERTKKNLDEFKNNIVYHHGYIPDTFSNSKTPRNIVYLHIDLNSTNPTIDTLDFFFPRLLKGGVIVFDDYGNTGYPDTKIEIDEFFKNKPGALMQSPTGQAIYYV